MLYTEFAGGGACGCGIWGAPLSVRLAAGRCSPLWAVRLRPAACRLPGQARRQKLCAGARPHGRYFLRRKIRTASSADSPAAPSAKQQAAAAPRLPGQMAPRQQKPGPRSKAGRAGDCAEHAAAVPCAGKAVVQFRGCMFHPPFKPLRRGLYLLVKFMFCHSSLPPS